MMSVPKSRIVMRVCSPLLATAIILTACGQDRESTVRPPETTADEEIDCAPGGVVDAADVEIIGSNVAVVAPGIVLTTAGMSDEQTEVVEWALGRYEVAGLQLPPQIEVAFDPSKAMCDGATGKCEARRAVPMFRVCSPSEPETAARILDRKIVLLHELGHIWHWARGDGAEFPDYSPIVGGEPASPSVAWDQRMEERVAMIISWGLLDQPRRPVLLELSCAEKFLIYRELTGSDPVGPLEVVCLPSE
jgi:hypothetical protein